MIKTHKLVLISIIIILLWCIIPTNGFANMQTSGGKLDVELESLLYDSSYLEVITNDLLYSNGSALGVLATDKIQPAVTDPPHVDLSFTADITATYYLWMRHTASVASESGQSVFLSLEGAPYTFFQLTAEPTEPKWVMLDAISKTAGETASVRIRRRQKASIGLDRYIVTTDANYVPNDNALGLTPAGMSNAYRVSTSNGYKMFEAESVTIRGSGAFGKIGSIFGYFAGLSGNDGLENSSDYSFSSASSTEAHLEFNFTPDTNGTYCIWVRGKPDSASKSVAVSFDRGGYAQYLLGSPAGEYEWRQIGSVRAKSGYGVNVRLRAVVGHFSLDNFVITDSIFKIPSGKSGAITEISTVIPSGLYTTPSMKVNTHPRLYFTAEDIPEMREKLMAEENINAYLSHKRNVEEGMKSSFTGQLAQPAYGKSNFNDRVLGIIESLAFEYAMTNNIIYGNKAVSAMMNYLDTIVYVGNYSSTYNRPAGHMVFTASQVYDWCYNLIDGNTRNDIINRVIEIIAAGMTVKWPPGSGDAVTGLTSEAMIQRDILGFAVAVGNERRDIYNAVLGMVIDKFVPTKKYISKAHMNPQGSHYSSYRGQWDIIATFIMDKIGYPNIYGDDLEYMPYSTIYSRRPDGQVLRDGDTPGDGAEIGSYYTLTYNQRLIAYTAAYYKNPYLKREAARLNEGFSNFSYGHGNMSPVEFLCLNDPELTSENIGNMPLTKYFDSPIGAMIARTGWQDGVSSEGAIAFMKMKEIWFANHDQLDSGHFQLYYKGILASDSGNYTGGQYGSDHDLGYNKRSVAHNTVVVRDGVGYKYGSVVSYDGGQVPINNGDQSGNLADFMPNTERNTGKVTGYQFGPDPIEPEYTYLEGDITKAYNSNSVSDFERNFMFFNMKNDEHPAALVVFDRVTSTNANFQKAWLLHGINQPVVNGNRTVFRNDQYGYNGKMTVDTLLPAPGNTTINVVGGTGYEAYDGTQNHPSVIPEAAEGTVKESSGYRMEVIPTAAENTNYFLHVIQVGDAVTQGSQNGTKPLDTQLIETDGWAGAVIGDRVALFRKNKGRVPSGAVRFSFSGEGTYKIAIADLGVGQWNARYGSDDGEIIAVLNVTEEGGIGYFEGPAGYYKIASKNSTPPSTPIPPVIEPCEDYNIRIDGKLVFTPANAVSQGGEMLLPLKSMCNLIGASFSVNENAVYASKGGNTLILNESSNIAILNNERIKLKYPVAVHNGYLMVPTDIFCKAFYCFTEVDDSAKTINLKIKEAVNVLENKEYYSSTIGGLAGTYSTSLADVSESGGDYTFVSKAAKNSRLILQCGDYSNSTEKIMHHSVVFKNKPFADGEQFFYMVAKRTDNPNSQKYLRFLWDGTVRDANDNILMGYSYDKEYKIDMLLNLKTGHTVFFIDGRLVAEYEWGNYVTGSGLSSMRYEFSGTKGAQMVLSDFECEVYSGSIRMLDLLRMYGENTPSPSVNDRFYGLYGTALPVTTGINVETGGHSSVTENNISGYTATVSDNAGGILRLKYNIDMPEIIHHQGQLMYNTSTVGDYGILLRCDEKNTEPFVTFCGDGKLLDLNGNKLMNFEKNRYYKIDIIVNKQMGEARLYVDNILQYVALWNEVQSVSTFNEVRYIFPANAVGSSIVLKNIVTSTFDTAVASVASRNVVFVLGDDDNPMEPFIGMPSYEMTSGKLNVFSKLYGDFPNGTLIYAMYDQDGRLLSTALYDTDGNQSCVFNLDEEYIGNIVVKVFAWKDLNFIKPIVEHKVRTISIQ